jgi:hypothetical protein
MMTITQLSWGRWPKTELGWRDWDDRRIWLTMAAAIRAGDKIPDCNTPSYWHWGKKRAGGGLCWAITVLSSRHGLPQETAARLEVQLLRHKLPSASRWQFWWPLDAEGDRERAALCERIAAELP